MKRLDAHQHFWKFHPIKDAWISDKMEVLKQDFMPPDLYPMLKENDVDGCVAVQAARSLEETRFLLGLTRDYPFIYGVVGWIDLLSNTIEKDLESFADEKKLKGFRHIVQAETNTEFLRQAAFLSGMRALKKEGYAYDLLITADQLKQAIAFAGDIDDQPIVIDHLAKPRIVKGKFDDAWATEIKELSKYENFYCKLSGLVTEADWSHWQPEDIEPYIDHILLCFGPGRIMFGSDWPVCTLAADYKEVIQPVNSCIAKLSSDEQKKIWYQTAEAFYNL